MRRNRIQIQQTDLGGAARAYFINRSLGSRRRGVSLGLQHVQIVKSEGLKRLDGRKPPEESFDNEYDDADEEV